ncbi:hypothetical protein DPMN_146456 [Dreissena polymorpha]|uniref:Pre-mRNA-splicing factor SYF1 central HAT repeats domain-containing protein n=1 Tax=Dreissena polymorpha TaxID=45954 RepID=A0A9D4F5W0_DREPO|nr:hypothetical protein DPMN_146456 [Dreissena polymorpha]
MFPQLCKENAEEYIEYLKTIGWLDEAAQKLADIINDENFVSKEGKSKHQVSQEYDKYLFYSDLNIFLRISQIMSFPSRDHHG